MHHSVPSSKTGRSYLKFKRGDFSTCDAPRTYWTAQNSDHPEIIDQIHS
jgi:hypothetical protein